MLSARLVGALLGAWILTHAPIVAQSGSQDTPREPDRAVLWREPSDIAMRDLFDGPDGGTHAPHGTTFRFLKEDLGGSNPKYVVQDDAGTKWKLKLGWEAQPETAASRIVSALGYFADNDYYLANFCLAGLPEKLHRGRSLIDANGCTDGGRLKLHEDDAATGQWRWRQNPFTGTREFNGLRTLMAVINNWDVKDINTRDCTMKDADGEVVRAYWVSDLGASFGTTRLVLEHARRGGNLKAYRESRFIVNTTECCVDFGTPDRAAPMILFNPPEYYRRLGLRWIGRQIPRYDARWMGRLLSRLSADQIRDAFRAAGYSEEESSGFTAVVEERIAALQGL